MLRLWHTKTVLARKTSKRVGSLLWMPGLTNLCWTSDDTRIWLEKGSVPEFSIPITVFVLAVWLVPLPGECLSLRKSWRLARNWGHKWILSSLWLAWCSPVLPVLSCHIDPHCVQTGDSKQAADNSMLIPLLWPCRKLTGYKISWWPESARRWPELQSN